MAAGSEVPTSGIRVQVSGTGIGSSQYQFHEDFRIGRSSACEVRIEDEHVSRCHAVVELRNGQWSIRDLGSSNGIYLDKDRLESVVLDRPLSISLGVAGPEICFDVPSADNREPTAGNETRWLHRYLAELPQDAAVGERTLMIRKALRRVQRKHRSRYAVIIGCLALLQAGASGYAFFLRVQLSDNLRLARDLF